MAQKLNEYEAITVNRAPRDRWLHKSKIFVNRLLSDSGRERIIKEEQIMHEVVEDLLDKISKKASKTKSQFGKEKKDEW